MQARFKIFKSGVTPWVKIFQAAADFASTLGPERLIGISHSCDQHVGVVTVWYWALASEEWTEAKEVSC